jgi:hypothetical protein
MYPLVVTRDPTAVEMEVQSAYLEMFPKGDRLYVPRVFGWVLECFTGNYEDYLPVDTRYHDFEHTLQGTLCMARLLRGRHAAGAQPKLTPDTFHIGLAAILLHDTGYLKRRGDNFGTGAKYTVTHVDRSAEFAAALLSRKGFDQKQVQAARNMIHCTGINARLHAIPFQSKLERIVGFALGTSDLLGQMAAEDYVDKLPTLYSEFAEAADFSGDRDQFIASFKSAGDLISKTPGFWRKVVLPKLENDFLGLYRYLAVPYPDGPNSYFEQVEANIARLDRMLAGRT